MKIALAVVLTGLCGLMAAEELPEAPSSLAVRPASMTQNRPRLQRERFWDHGQKAQFSVTLGIRVADAALTCHTIAAGGREDWLSVHSCAGTSAWILGGQVTQTVAQWLLWKAGHRKLSRWLGWVAVAPNVAGIAYTVKHQGSIRAPQIGDSYPTPLDGKPCVTSWDGSRWVTRCY